MNKSFRRFLSLILAVFTVLSCVAFASAEEAVAEFKYGDITSDGNINSSDALAALKHSVGIALLEGEALRAADVNGDSSVNSSDALEILKYSVGSIKLFPIEVAVKKPGTDAEILALYAKTINEAKKTIPAYKLKASTKGLKVAFSGTAMSFVPKDEVEAMEKDMMKESSFQNIFRAGSSTAFANLPGECKITDPSLLKEVKLTELADGNYQIDIAFKDDKNPKAGSPVVTMLNVPDKDTFIKQMNDELGSAVGGEDISASAELKNLEYTNCRISCVIDVKTGNFVSVNTEYDMRTNMTTYVAFFSMGTDTTTKTVNEYSNFIY